MDTNRAPRLSIGLPVYNGDEYLEQSLDAILGQTYEDFELVISSNASTDATDEICRDYQASDPRIRFSRQSKNVGAASNHDIVLRQSVGELFKWASGDDLYARDLLSRCIEILDADRDVILAHSWTAAVDATGKVIQAFEYPLSTDSPRAPERFRSQLFDNDGLPGAIRGDDFYGVFRSDVLRRVKPHGSFYHADQTYMAEVALYGRFCQVPDWLYFRRHHPNRAHQANPTVNSWCGNLDPRRANRILHPPPRLFAEYLLGYVTAVARAPLTTTERIECYRHLSRWIIDRVRRRVSGRGADEPVALDPPDDPSLSVRAVVAGQQGGS